jgi:hypothetical protein
MWHPEEIYKDRLVPTDCPRTGDYAEVRHSCCRNENGMVVRIVNAPHWTVVFCADCQGKVKDWIVQVEPITDWEGWMLRNPGPYFYPVAWLKRWEANQVNPQGK